MDFYPSVERTCSAGYTLVLHAGHLGGGMAVKGILIFPSHKIPTPLSQVFNGPIARHSVAQLERQTVLAALGKRKQCKVKVLRV